jgi:hypothetical protein
MTQLDTKRNGKPVSPLSIRDTAARMSDLQKRKVWQAADAELRLLLKRVGDRMKAKHGSQYPAPGAGLSQRSGKGLEGLTSPEFTNDGRGLTATLTMPRYLKYHEVGGTIRPHSALNGDGTPKRYSARQWANTFLVKGSGGGWTICTKQGRRIVPLYVLRTSINLTPRLGLREAFRKESRAFLKGLAKRFAGIIMGKNVV